MKLTRGSLIAQRHTRATIVLAASFFAFACIAASAPSCLASQSGTTQQTKEVKPDLKPFLGTWKGSFGGKVFAILVVKQDERGDIAGTLE